ncbi:LysR substrate-binding domain-containing protein [Gryllotalpicola protaetiae]|uniref:LysR family transcriptional regulator n=1 Tax=Gryllotalpicola protaetiae TaxID=2419771 RepID=A0A387BWJ1_9MICO|nr:LysR substrate-binding domain-containing protein [Gryllotalpicola protaetiae]AYG02691.1 LysR family transcriptional regulator [Gryllotalpicola protaetiae]
MPHSLRIAYARGVTPGKWARIWGERFRRHPLELIQIEAVTDADAELQAVRNGAADLAFVRLAEGETQPGDVHLIALYEERPFVVAPKGHVIEAADEVALAALEGEVRHPFDDDIEQHVEVVAANVGVVVVPQSIARLYARKDVVSRPVTDGPGWRVGLAWLKDAPAEAQPHIDEFIGVVRGRTANSSRGADAGAKSAEQGKPPAKGAAAPAASGADRRRKPRAQGRPSRAGRSRRRPTR